MKKSSSIFHNILGFVGFILIFIVLSELLLNRDDQLFSGILFMALFFVVLNIQFLKKQLTIMKRDTKN